MCRFCDNSLIYATKQCLLVCRFLEIVSLFDVAIYENADLKPFSALKSNTKECVAIERRPIWHIQKTKKELASL